MELSCSRLKNCNVPNGWVFCEVAMGTGGARFRAGRSGWHEKAQLRCSLDVLRWAREGMLQTEHSAGWAWCAGEVAVEIGYDVTASAVASIERRTNAPARSRLVNRLRLWLTRYWFG